MPEPEAVAWHSRHFSFGDSEGSDEETSKMVCFVFLVWDRRVVWSLGKDQSTL